MTSHNIFPGPGRYRSIAPLFNFMGLFDAIALTKEVVIRRLNDSEREELGHALGVGDVHDPMEVDDLDDFTHVIDYQWPPPEARPSYMPRGIDDIRDVIRTLRLFHHGGCSTKFIWARADPPDDVFAAAFAPVPHNTDLYRYPMVRIDSGDCKVLTTLLHGIYEAREDRRLALALRRFDSAYAREEDEDSLIDLWIAFEALLLPDGRSELSYRAALRIAQLTAKEPGERRGAFEQARNSYRCRSQVVHGEAIAGGLDQVVDQTRELARKALRAWITNPPAGIDEIDKSLFEPPSNAIGSGPGTDTHAP